MTIIDAIVIVVCAAIGWTVVSQIFRKKETSGLREIGNRNLADEEIRASWSELLQVEPNAPAEAIEAAYVMRVKALRNSFPAVLTDAEVALFQRGELLLRRALEMSRTASAG